jgi:hypothetical protein
MENQSCVPPAEQAEHQSDRHDLTFPPLASASSATPQKRETTPQYRYRPIWKTRSQGFPRSSMRGSTTVAQMMASSRQQCRAIARQAARFSLATMSPRLATGIGRRIKIHQTSHDWPTTSDKEDDHHRQAWTGVARTLMLWEDPRRIW